MVLILSEENEYLMNRKKESIIKEYLFKRGKYDQNGEYCKPDQTILDELNLIITSVPFSGLLLILIVPL